MDERELSPADVAKELNVSPSTVRRWSKKGLLKPTRVLPGSNYHRYSRETVDEFRRRLEAGEVEVKTGS